MYDWLKPVYHFTPEKNWMNDPNGLCYYQGVYHLFFQHNPDSDRWGNIHWGHACSKDLVHWKRLPVAFGPSVEKGEKHCYSGCAVIDGDVARIIYTSIGEGERGPEKGAQQWMTVSRDGLVSWEKDFANPLLVEKLHPGLAVTFWRDPFIWKDKDGLWYAVMSGTLDGDKGCILIYRSQDLRSWTFLNVLYLTEQHPLLECPNLIPLGDLYLLVYSPVNQIHYHLGRITEEFTFNTVQQGILDAGSGRNGFYAPNTYMDLPEERRVMIGWLSDNGRLSETRIRGWAGAQSLPRELSLEEGRFAVDFVRECKLLRDGHLMLPVEQPAFTGRNFELVIDALVPSGGKLAIEVLANSEETEKTLIVYDGDLSTLSIERGHSTLFSGIDVSPVRQWIDAPTGKLYLDIFVDGSTIEVSVNHETILSARVYPSDEQSVYNRITSSGTASVSSREAWRISPAISGQTGIRNDLS